MRYHTCRLESRCSPVPLFARMKVLVVDSSASFEAEAHLFGRLARNASQVRGRQTRERGRLTQPSGQARCDRAGAHLIPRTGARASRRQASRSLPFAPTSGQAPRRLRWTNSARIDRRKVGTQNVPFYPLVGWPWTQGFLSSGPLGPPGGIPGGLLGFSGDGIPLGTDSNDCGSL